MAIKLRINLHTFIFAALTIFLFYLAGKGFYNANSLYKGVAQAEALIGTEFVEFFAQQREQETGITINNPNEFYLNSIKYSKSRAAFYQKGAIFALIFGINGIIQIMGQITVITESGLRTYKAKEAIPIFAEHDRSNNQIIIKVNDLTGNVQKLVAFNATQKNLASLGQFIKHEELEIKEENQ